MSQNKVDRRKYEKKHRAELMRKEKAKKAAAITVVVVIICGILAGTVGYQIYRVIPKYVKADKLESVVEKTLSDSGYDGVLPATATDAEEDTSADDTSEEAASDEDTSNEAASE